MTFNPGTQLDPGQISDRRGMGGRGGMALGGGGAVGLDPAARVASSWAATRPTSGPCSSRAR